MSKSQQKSPQGGLPSGQNGSAPSLLSELLGLESKTLQQGKVTFRVSKFTLRQLDMVKDLIAEVQTASQVKRRFQDSSTGAEMNYDDTDLLKGFLETERLVPRLLELCVTSEPEVAIDELPAEIAVKLLQLALEVNNDFFSAFSALVASVTEKVEALGPQAKAPTQGQEEVIGKRSPQHLSETDFQLKN